MEKMTSLSLMDSQDSTHLLMEKSTNLSGRYILSHRGDISEALHYVMRVPFFCWQDLCTIENAIKPRPVSGDWDWSPPKYFILRTEGRLAVAVPGVPVRGGVGVAESLPVRHDGPWERREEMTWHLPRLTFTSAGARRLVEDSSTVVPEESRSERW